jgi:hypothetical protein
LQTVTDLLINKTAGERVRECGPESVAMCVPLRLLSHVARREHSGARA